MTGSLYFELQFLFNFTKKQGEKMLENCLFPTNLR